MKKLIVVTILAVLLCAASLYAALSLRTERQDLLAKLEEHSAQLQASQKGEQAAAAKLSAATASLDETRARLEQSQKDLQFTEAKLKSLQDRSRSHTAVCDFKRIAPTLSRTRGIGPGNLGRYKVEDILNLIAHGSPEPAVKADLQEVRYGGSCYLPPGRVTRINDVPIDKPEELKQALKTASELTILVENPPEETPPVEAAPDSGPASAPAAPEEAAPAR